MAVLKPALNEEAALDIIGRPLNVDDFVVYYNHVYKILAIKNLKNSRGKVFNSTATLFLAKPSKTTKKRSITCNELTLLPAHDVLMWILKKPADVY